MTNSTHRWFTLLTAMAFCPPSAEAQTTARSLEELAGIGKAEAVLVIDMSGRRVKGALTAVDEDSLSLATRGGAGRSRDPK